MLSPMATQDRGWCVQEVRIAGRRMRQINFFMNGNFTKIMIYSVRRLSTGSAMAALMEWKPTVMKVMSTAMVAARGKTHQAIVVRYAKSCSQVCIANQAMGEAMIRAMATRRRNSFESRPTMVETEAPSTFLMPISLVRWMVL